MIISNRCIKRCIHIKKNFFPDELAHSKYEHFTSERRRENLKILFNNTSIIPFKWRGKYLCFYCGKIYDDYPEFRKHTKSHGVCTTKDHALKVIKRTNDEIKIDISEINCEICNEPFTSLSEIVNHLIGKHNLEYDKTVEVPFQEYMLVDSRCQFCGEQFTYFGYLIIHINTAHPQNCFICDDCGLMFNKKRDLCSHIRHNHRRGGYPCDECSHTFESQGLLNKHKNNFHFRKCKTCHLSVASYSLLKKHIKLEHTDNKCPHCAKEYQSRQGLIMHLRACEPKVIGTTDKSTKLDPQENTLEPRVTKNLTQKRQNIVCVLNMSTATPFKFFAKFSCFHCPKKFTEFDDLKEHTVSEHPVCDLKSKCIISCKGQRAVVRIDVTSLACKLCCQPMEDLDVLAEHLISKHNANYDKSVTGCFEPFKLTKDKIPCPHCSKIFRYFATLVRHVNAVHSNNKWICDFCGRTFRNAANLGVHVSYSHTGSCECDVCGLNFKNQLCLGRHKAKMHDVKDFKCPKCPEQFQSQYQKQKHMIKVHDIGHKCNYCGRMFTRNSFMKDHVRRVHLKEKDVTCSVCNEKFFDNHLLKLHMVKHNGDRKFTCHICGKSFLRRSNLSYHIDMHKKYGHVEA